MQTAHYITGSCIISGNRVIKNGETIFASPSLPVSDFLDEIYRNLNPAYPKFHKMDKLGKLGWLAAEVLLMDAATKHRLPLNDTGIVLANANASLDTDIRYYQSVASIPSPALFVYTLPNIVIGEICIRHRFKGENAFFVFKTFDATFISRYVNDLFNDGLVEACICGWLDCLGEEYKAMLILVEKKQSAFAFSEETLLSIYNNDHG